MGWAALVGTKALPLAKQPDLFPDYRFCRARRRNWISVAMNEPPLALLAPKHARDAGSYGYQFRAATDLCSSALYLDDTC